jgi:thiamine-monophosphate kinase
MNETEFVSFLEKNFPFCYGKGVGDDASVVRCGDVFQLVSKDLLIENIHFKAGDFTLEELALKALAVNLSDIAAMGGQPRYFYLGLGFPRQWPEERCLEFFNGLVKGCRQWQVELAGGDFSASDRMVISITVVGETTKPIYRHNARLHDLIGITGITGESAIGLKLLLQGVRQGPFVARHKQVVPEIAAGRILSRYANAMIDVSDGLLMDLMRILAASRKGAHLYYEKLPVTSDIKEICREKGWDEYDTVLAGGEDYVLLFTLSNENWQKLTQEHPQHQWTVIGEITGKPGQLDVTHQGKKLQITQPGYDHFSQK